MRKKQSEACIDPMSCLSVYVPGQNGRGTKCVGFIYLRRDRFEGFDADTKSIGLFATQAAAADAITMKAAITSKQEGIL